MSELKTCVRCGIIFDPKEMYEKGIVSEYCDGCFSKTNQDFAKKAFRDSTLVGLDKRLAFTISATRKHASAIKDMEAKLHKETNPEAKAIWEKRIENAKIVFNKGKQEVQDIRDDIARVRRGGTSQILEKAREKQHVKTSSN